MWELDYKESWVPKNWCFWTVVLEKTVESPLDFKEIQPVYPKGNQSWTFTGRTDAEAETPILWPPEAKSWLIWKDSDARKDWRQEEKGMTEDETVGWWMASRTWWTWVWVNSRSGDVWGNLECCSPWGCKESDTTERSNWTYPTRKKYFWWNKKKWTLIFLVKRIYTFFPFYLPMFPVLLIDV